MLQFQGMASFAGLKLLGRDEDLELLYTVIHDISAKSPLVSDDDDLFLGFAYDVRHARQGDRIIIKPERQDRETGYLYGFKMGWPLFILYERLVRTSLSFMQSRSTHHMIAYSLEAIVEDAFREFKDQEKRLLESWRRFLPTHPAYFTRAQSRASAFASWTKAQRRKHLADLLDSFNPMYESYPARFYEHTPDLIRLDTLNSFQGADWPDY